MQAAAPVRLTEVPPKPTCTQIFNTGPCTDLWRNYNQAVQQRPREELQLHVNRQKELASTQATAPLQRQISDLKKLAEDERQQIEKLQDRMQVDSAAAVRQMQADSAAILQATSYAHTQGLWQGAGIGVGGTLLLFGLMFGVRKLRRNFRVTKKPQARAASA